MKRGPGQGKERGTDRKQDPGGTGIRREVWVVFSIQGDVFGRVAAFIFWEIFLKLWYNVYNMKFTIVTVFHCRFRDIKYVPILGQPAPLFPFGALSSCKTESLSPLEDDPPSARAQPLATACLLSVSVSLTPGGPSWK